MTFSHIHINILDMHCL